jgi:hypothetical protein
MTVATSKSLVIYPSQATSKLFLFRLLSVFQFQTFLAKKVLMVIKIGLKQYDSVFKIQFQIVIIKLHKQRQQGNNIKWSIMAKR